MAEKHTTGRLTARNIEKILCNEVDSGADVSHTTLYVPHFLLVLGGMIELAARKRAGIEIEVQVDDALHGYGPPDASFVNCFPWRFVVGDTAYISDGKPKDDEHRFYRGDYVYILGLRGAVVLSEDEYGATALCAVDGMTGEYRFNVSDLAREAIEFSTDVATVLR